MTLSFYGAEKVVDHYNVMGPVKAALEASVRYLAHELGPKGIRVNAISAAAVATRAASGIEHFDELLNETARKAPLRRTVDEVGRAALLLASDYTTASPARCCTSMAGSTSKAWCSTKKERAAMQVTDPVCNMTIESEQAAGREVWQGQNYYFCSKSCQEKFRAAPDRYAKKPDNPATGGAPPLIDRAQW